MKKLKPRQKVGASMLITAILVMFLILYITMGIGTVAVVVGAIVVWAGICGGGYLLTS